MLVRLLTGDHPAQYKASLKLFSSESIFIPDTVVLETEWILRAADALTPADVGEAFRRVFGLENVSVPSGQRIARAIDRHEQGLDFADALHLVSSEEHELLKTFDVDFIKRAKGVSQCRVEKP